MIERAEAEQRFWSMVTGPAARGELSSLRECSDLVVESVSVNGPRVDVVASSGARQWRAVFFADEAAVDNLVVFERPAVVEPTEPIAVIVNGPSSSGKSSVIRAIQRGSALPWVVFDEPMFGSVQQSYLIWRDRAERLHRGFLDGIAALANAGNAVALSAGGHPQRAFDEAFTGVRVLRVGLDCDADELQRRERRRVDVSGGLALSSLHVHDGWNYHLRFDTEVNDPSTIAAAVLSATA